MCHAFLCEYWHLLISVSCRLRSRAVERENSSVVEPLREDELECELSALRYGEANRPDLTLSVLGTTASLRSSVGIGSWS